MKVIMLFLSLGVFTANASTDMHRLIWNDDPTSTMTVAWRQLSDEAKVYYDTEARGKDVSAYAHQLAATKKNDHLGLKTHFANLKELKADTQYYFVIADKESVSRPYYFKTASTKADDFTFIAGGDTKSKSKSKKKKSKSKKKKSKSSSLSPYEYGRKSNRMVAKLRPLFVLFVGDFTTNSDVAERWVDWFQDWNDDTCSPDGRMYPLIPVHGNHENPNGLTDLQMLFDTPKAVYYTVDFGTDFFRVFVLNSELSSGQMNSKISDMEAKWIEQTKWLEQTLEASAHFQYRGAMYHKPMRPHTKGKKTPAQVYRDWAPLFAKYKMNLSFDGDSHLHKITYPLVPDANGEEGFRRDDVNGTMFIGEGSWGAKPRPANLIRDCTMSHGGFNQFKLIHVKNKEFFIHTVDTTNESEVGQLSVDQEFEFPEGIKLFDTPGMGKAIKYPFVGK